MVLRILLGALGLAAVGIALAVVALGPATAADGAEQIFDLLARAHHSSTGAWPAVMDNELRFYAPFWGAYGVVLLAVAYDLQRWLRRVPALAGLFFLGGIGRAVSILAVGLPHPVFVALMAIELLLPPVLMLLWWRARAT